MSDLSKRKMLPTLSYPGGQPSILEQAYRNRPSDWGSEKCPCCGGYAASTKRVCSTCKRDAKYDDEWAKRVRAVEEKLAAKD